MPDSEPYRLGEFTIVEKIGQGAMGAIYKAHQASLDRMVALKLLPPHYARDPDFLARFKYEAMNAATVSHANLVQIFSAGEEDGTHYFAMEWVDGESLGARLERKGRIDPSEALAAAYYVAQALECAWKNAKIIHRDIKPDNIFLSSKGTVKLGDLGLAKMLGDPGAGVTQTGSAIGTPHYISPEQALGSREVDFRADIYSLGCTIFHAISGQLPYRGENSMGIMLQHVSQPPPRILDAWPKCPAPIVGLLDRMLRKKPEERFESYAELLGKMLWVMEQLDQPSPPMAVVASTSVPAPTVRPKSAPTARVPVSPAGSPAAKAPPTSGHAWKIPAIITCLAVVMIALAVWQPWKRPTPGPPKNVPAQPPSAPSTVKPMER